MSYGANVNLGGEIYPKQIGYVWDAVGMSYVVAQQPVGGPGGVTVLVDGGDATQGAVADTAWSGTGSGTVVAILKAIYVRLGGGSGGGPATIADGADVAQGAIADAAWSGAGSGTVTAVLKYIGAKIEAVRALLAGGIAVTGTFWQAVQPVSGTFWQATQPVSQASQPLPTGAATSANQATEMASLASIDGKLANPLPVTGPATDAQMRASPLPISGTVTVTDGSGPLTVDGTVAVSNFPATQPISAAALPLPANAAQETGGNLATLVARTVPGQAQMLASLPVTLAYDSMTDDSRIARRAAEDALVAALDAAAATLATRSYRERISLTDRRGRLTRGTAR